MYPETGNPIYVDSEPPFGYARGFMEGAGFGCIVTILLILMFS